MDAAFFVYTTYRNECYRSSRNFLYLRVIKAFFMAIQNLVLTEGIIDSNQRRTSIRPLGKEYAHIRPQSQLSVIVAVDENNAIGLRGGMLWHLRDDLRRFRALTTGNAVIMGRKTWESLPKRPLPDRRNIVVTRSKDYVAEGAVIAHSVQEAIGLAAPAPEIFFIGGGELYRETLGMATRLYLTRILDKAEEADTFFPAINADEWTLVEEERIPVANGNPAFRFENYVRTGRE